MLERNTAVGVAAQNNADPRKGNGGVDRDTGEGQQSEIEVVYLITVLQQTFEWNASTLWPRTYPGPC